MVKTEITALWLMTLTISDVGCFMYWNVNFSRTLGKLFMIFTAVMGSATLILVTHSSFIFNMSANVFTVHNLVNGISKVIVLMLCL